MRTLAVGVAAAIGLWCCAAQATVYYTVYEGTGTTGTVDLSFETSKQIPSSPAISVSDLGGLYAADFTGKVEYSPGDGVTFSGPLVGTIDANFPINDLAAIGQYSVGLSTATGLLTRTDTLLVSNTAPATSVPEPSSWIVMLFGMAGFLSARRWTRGADGDGRAMLA